MAYPTLEQYNQAFSAHSQLLSDSELKTGTLAKSGLGLPLAISGGFALTYTVATPRGKYAVRCFHRESKGLERRYAAISKKLASLRSQYFLDFQFQPNGIRVDGVAYPIVKMAWAGGATLGSFLEDNLRTPRALGELADALVQLAAHLQKESIAHGDLSADNIMVSRDGSSVQLIDYDGMFVDEIRDLGSSELGNINFQHPQRKSLNPFDATLDRFSFLALWVAVRALQGDPSLWDKTNSEATALLFRSNDFLDPASSAPFALVSKNAGLAAHARNFAAVCKSPMGNAPTLADFLAGRNIPTSSVGIGSSSAAQISAATRAGYVGAFPVLPASDYAACLRSVGDKVEVVGRIVEVKEALTRGGKPYIFVNFGDWKGSIFKAAIWSDGISQLRSKPDASWQGKWVSVVGLMEPPYVNKRYRYSHVSITLGSSGAMTVITEAEARWRLAGAGKTAGTFSLAASSNQQALDRIRGIAGAVPGSRGPGAPTASAPPAARSSAASSNAQVLQQIRAASGGTQAPVLPPSSNVAPHQAPPPPQAGAFERFIKWLFG